MRKIPGTKNFSEHVFARVHWVRRPTERIYKKGGGTGGGTFLGYRDFLATKKKCPPGYTSERYSNIRGTGGHIFWFFGSRVPRIRYRIDTGKNQILRKIPGTGIWNPGTGKNMRYFLTHFWVKFSAVLCPYWPKGRKMVIVGKKQWYIPYLPFFLTIFSRSVGR